MEWRWERGEGAGKEGEEHSWWWREGGEGWKEGDTWKGGGIGTGGVTGKEGEMGMEGEAGMRSFPLAEEKAFSLLGSIRPSHILPAVRSATY